MADTQVLVAGQGAAPLDYTVPNAQEILLKVCRATFDGSGAGAAFIPLIELVSDGGVVVADAVGQSVAAGASADASFFPGAAKPAQAAGGSAGVAFTRGTYQSGPNPPISVGAGTNNPQPFYTFDNTDPTVFSWSTTTNHDDTLTLHPPGSYLCYCTYQGGTGGDVGGPIIVPSSGPFTINNYGFMDAAPGIPGGFANAWCLTGIHSTANDYTVGVTITNPSAFAMSVFIVDFYVYYLATGA